MFLLFGCSNAFQEFLCFVHGQGQRAKETENKDITKKLADFHDQIALLTLI